MRIVHTADWHIGKNLNDYSLLGDQRCYFEQFVKELERLKPDALVVSGDLYDRSIPSAEATELLSKVLCEIVLEQKIETFLVSGNHDSKERLSFGSELLQKSGLHIAGKIKRDIMKVNFKGINFYLVPFIEPHNVKQLYPDMIIKNHNTAMQIYAEPMLKELNKNEINLLVSHGLFGFGVNSDVSVGGSEMIDASIFSDFDYVALGHLHSHRTAGRDNMVFSGSPLKYSIKEATQEKSFTVLDILSKTDINISSVSIKPLHDVRIIEGDFDYLTDRINNIDLEDYIFVNLTDKTIILNAMSRLKAIFPNVIGLKYINLNVKVSEGFIKEKAQISNTSNLDLFENFYFDVTNERLNETEKAYISEALKECKGEQNDTN